MMKLLPLPDALAAWRGSAAALADKVNEVLTQLTASDTEEVNERLVRYYVQEGVLDPPEREGREAMFGFRQLVQAIAARFLLRDSWPLRKVAELIRTSDIDALLALAPGATSRTPAEAAIARIRGSEPQATVKASRPVAYAMVRDSTAFDFADSALEKAADITQRRSALTDNLRALGNESGAPERRRLLRLELAPWCHVDLDAEELRKMDEHVPEILGTALTQALQEERLKKGE
jgi:DNA-binding transcriptional MerR regulator